MLIGQNAILFSLVSDIHFTFIAKLFRKSLFNDLIHFNRASGGGCDLKRFSHTQYINFDSKMNMVVNTVNTIFTVKIICYL